MRQPIFNNLDMNKDNWFNYKAKISTPFCFFINCFGEGGTLFKCQPK
jgi:hypothetical protein